MRLSSRTRRWSRHPRPGQGRGGEQVSKALQQDASWTSGRWDAPKCLRSPTKAQCGRASPATGTTATSAEARQRLGCRSDPGAPPRSTRRMAGQPARESGSVGAGDLVGCRAIWCASDRDMIRGGLRGGNYHGRQKDANGSGGDEDRKVFHTRSLQATSTATGCHVCLLAFGPGTVKIRSTFGLSCAGGPELAPIPALHAKLASAQDQLPVVSANS